MHAKTVQKVLVKGVHWKHIPICTQVYIRSNVAFASGQAFKKLLFQSISWSFIQKAVNWPANYSVPSNFDESYFYKYISKYNTTDLCNFSALEAPAKIMVSIWRILVIIYGQTLIGKFCVGNGWPRCAKRSLPSTVGSVKSFPDSSQILTNSLNLAM